ncbi:MAG: hypothetical protein HY290_16375 [Planctomycetia bacterium]|nr:hypothetical protein [Planctomycetia bacterium]
MTRTCCASRIVLCVLACCAAFGNRSAAAQEKPSITVVLPSFDDLFADFKVAFDLVGEKGDDKGFETLKSTIETFLVGIDTTKPGGVRIYPTTAGLQPVLSFPVKNAQDYRKLVMNLWDLDIKTSPPPEPRLIRQVPPSVQQRTVRARLTADERLVFKLYDAFLRQEPGQVHFSQQLEQLRLAKGAVPANLLEKYRLAALVDGTAQPAEKRKQAFEVAKREMLAALVRGEHESEVVFNSRKALTEHQVAELERFFVESEKILLGWNLSREKKEAELNIDIAGLPGSDIEKSVELLDKTPDEFAGVSKKDAVFSLSLNFALDPLRQAFVKNIANVERAVVKKAIDEAEKKSKEEKAVDSDLADLVFDILDGTAQLGVANGFIRSWRDAGGELSTVAGGRIPDGSKAKFEKMLTTLAQRSTDNKLEEKIHTEQEIEIHKLTIPKLAQELPEFVGKDGVVYVGIHDKTVWLAAGSEGLDLLKRSIGEVDSTGPKNGLVIDLAVKLGPYVEILNNYYIRNPLAAPAPAARKTDDSKKKSGAKSSEPRRVEAFISAADLRKLALEAFKPGKDMATLTLGREDKTAKVRIKFEEGAIRFAGSALSKFVKENLED